LRSVLAVAAVLLTCASPRAADLTSAPPPASSDGPTFSFTGYGWASAIDGRGSTLPPLPPTDLNLSFGDILKDMNGALMGSAEISIENWSFLADAMLSQVTPGGSLPGPYFSSAEVRSRTLTLQGGVLYRIHADETFDLDVGAGLRFWDLDNKLKISPGSLNREIDYRQSENWLDPVLAARMTARLGGPWSVTVAGDIGGFDLASRLTWQAVGTVNYEWNKNWEFRTGYRALYVDYRKDDFLYDTTMHGPIFAAAYRF